MTVTPPRGSHGRAAGGGRDEAFLGARRVGTALPALACLTFTFSRACKMRVFSMLMPQKTCQFSLFLAKGKAAICLALFTDSSGRPRVQGPAWWQINQGDRVPWKWPLSR